MKVLSYENLQYLVSKIKEKFVQVEAGKGLSSNDFTSEEKKKLSELKSYTVATSTQDGLMASVDKKKIDKVKEDAEKNVIVGIKRNGSVLSPDTSRNVDIKVPIKLSELTNDKAYQTKEEVQALLSQINKMTKKIVDSLPSTGEEDIFYLVPKDGEENNVYDEYLWINGKFEKIGDTATSVDLQEITQPEIDVLFK